MVGLDAADALFDTAEETGGSKDAVVVSHTHTATSTSTVTDPGHFHSSDSNGAPNGIGAGAAYTTGYPNFPGKDTNTKTTGITVSTSTTNASTGSSGTNANVQPFIVVRMWKRTA